MIKMNFKATLLGLTILTLTSCTTKAQQTTHEVKIVSEMKNVMWKGQLYGNIHLDTIANKTNLYGLGPVEYLAGEILIIDGNSYKSTVTSDSTMKIEETYDIKARFLVTQTFQSGQNNLCQTVFRQFNNLKLISTK